MPIYISFLLPRKTYKQNKQFIFFLSKFCLFLSYKKIISESKSNDVQEVRGSFCYTRSEPTGCRILGEECNQIFLPVQWGVFSLRIEFARFNPSSQNFSLELFFFMLIVWYSALLIHVLKLFCYCYFVIYFKTFHFLLIYLFYFILIFSNNLREKSYFLLV